MTVSRSVLVDLHAAVNRVSCLRCGKIQKESEFAASMDCGWLSWGVGLLLVKPLKWTFSTLLGGTRVPPEEPFVVIELVKVCDEVEPSSTGFCCMYPKTLLDLHHQS